MVEKFFQVALAASARVPDQRAAGRKKGLLLGISAWLRVVGYLAVLQFDQKFRGSRFSAVLTFLEPLILVVLLVAIRGVLRDSLPNYGTSTFVFYSSGIFPFYVFFRLSVRLRGAAPSPQRRLPQVDSTQMVIASTIAETGIILTTMVVWFTVMWFLGFKEAAPVRIDLCIVSLAWLCGLGIGVGLLNAAATKASKIWQFVYGRATMALAFLSGVFFVVDLLPLSVRSIVVWNPIMHGIEWFRLGLYGTYPVFTLDRDYLIDTTAIVIILGIAAHRATLRFGQ
ncbi:ABC transporter permease [Reyranella sp.]|uniref:ABC transporter permease n=1 Tax=Reyranella sp. TaxID=1929291 RepID=UPI003D12D1F3